MDHLVKQILARHPEIRLGLVFGSTAAGGARPESDFDLALAANEPLDAEYKAGLMREIAVMVNRPVDLVDLLVAHGPILHQILTRGRLIVSADRGLYTQLIIRMLAEQADWIPYYRRILRERQVAWTTS